MRRSGTSGMRAVAVVAALAAAAAVGCSKAEDAVRRVAIAELAVGTWQCVAEDPDDAAEVTVRIDADGTFGVAFQVDPALGRGGEIPGTWRVVDGDLVWRMEGPVRMAPGIVPDFADFTLETERFTVVGVPTLEDDDGELDDPAEQDFDVDVHDKDAVTFSVPGGTPWTCRRQ